MLIFNPNEFAQFVRDSLAENEMSVQDLANEIGVSRASIYRMCATGSCSLTTFIRTLMFFEDHTGNAQLFFDDDDDVSLGPLTDTELKEQERTIGIPIPFPES